MPNIRFIIDILHTVNVINIVEYLKVSRLFMLLHMASIP